MLFAFGFNDSGGPLAFNHLGGIATDGHHLLVTDDDNNRVLIWNTLPTSPTTPPDIVLGQKNFYSNAAGHGLNGLNFPMQVYTVDGKVLVADARNNRILIWNTFPTENGQPADIVLSGNLTNPLLDINWPWGVWSDGNKLAVASTGGSRVLIWNTFPTKDNQPASISLSGVGNVHIGTPRQITSDGTHLIIGDHNPIPQNNNQGSSQQPPQQPPGDFVWDTFPTQTNQSYSYFMQGNQWDRQGMSWFRGAILANGTTLLLGSKLNVFATFPTSNSTSPTAQISGPPQAGTLVSVYEAGDGSDVAFAGGKLYMALYNPDMVAVFNGIPANPVASPNFTIGAPNIFSNPLDSNYFLTNPKPATNGKSLFVISDFDQKMYVYKNIPNQSDAHPDIVYTFTSQPERIALYNDTLAVSVQYGPAQEVYIWNGIPLNGQMPSINLTSIGGVSFEQIGGMAIDSKHFYIADSRANKVYIWNGVPSDSGQPYATLSIYDPSGISSDGKHLAVHSGLNSFYIYNVSQLVSDSAPLANLTIQDPLTALPLPGMLQNGFGIAPAQSGDPLVYNGMLFIADLGRNRVLIWNNITSAMSNSGPSETLGCLDNVTACVTEEGNSNTTMAWPSFLAYDGSRLWVGEYKFSSRLLRFDGN